MKVFLYLFLFVFGSLEVDSIEPETSFSLIVFEGSDWCTNCIKFEHNVLSNPEFIEYLKLNNISLVRIDFPRWEKQSKEVIKKNNNLAEQYNFQGDFPTVILSRSDSSDYIKLAHHNKITPDEFTGQIENYFLSNSK